jgi:hypothetical protein
VDQKELRKIAGASLAVTVMYNLGFLSLFYAVPLQFAALSNGRKAYLSVSLVSTVLILIVRFILLSATGFSELIVLDAVVVAVVATGLYFANFMLQRYSVPVKLGIVTAALGLLFISAAPFADGLESRIVGSIDKMTELMNSLSIPTETEGTVLLQEETFFLMVKDVFGRSVLAVFFFFLCYSWWSSSLLYQRMGGKMTPETTNWSLPDGAVWFLFLPLTVFLVDRLLNGSGLILLKGIPAYAVSNLLFIMGGLFGIKGLQIIRVMFRKWNVPRQMNLMLFLAMGMLAVIPGVNLILLIVVAGLGVSELWVNYRIFDKE